MKTFPLAAMPLFMILILTAMAPAARAATGDIALGARISSLGIGPDLTIGLSHQLNIRVAGHWGSYDIDGTSEDIDYECDLELLSGLVSAEWFPLKGRSFHLVAGALFNGNNLEARGETSPYRSYTLGGTDYSGTDIGRLQGDIDYNLIAPYVGLGWGNPVHKDSNWTFFLDLGVAYQGAADVRLTASGAVASDPEFQRNLQQEEEDLEDDLDRFNYYPVVALGLTYKF